MTIDVDYVLGMDDEVGSLDPKRLKEMPVWGTTRSGKLYEAER